MNDQKPAAERIRPILQAMERSIDSVRRSRAKDSSMPAAPSVMPTAAPVNHPQPTLAPTPIEAISDDGVPRLKARPKRLNSPFVDPLHNNSYRSQAG